MTNPPVAPLQQHRKTSEAQTPSVITFLDDFRRLFWIKERLRRAKYSMARIRRHPTAEHMSDALQKPPYLRQRLGDSR
jgi:hypothetical protein